MMRILPRLILLLILCEPLAAQQRPEGVRVNDRQLSLTYHNPLKSDGKLMSFIEGRRRAGNSESFGILFGGLESATPVVELRDARNTVLKALTTDDLLGRKLSGGVTVRRETPPLNPRRSETAYILQLPQGPAELIITALGAGDEQGGAPPQMIVSFALRTSVRSSMALHLSLPVVGNIESGEHGFVILSPGGNASIAASVYPGTRTLTAAGKRLSINVGPTEVGGTEATSLLWMVLNGVTGTSAAEVRALSREKLSKTTFGPNDPHLAVISAADREASHPSDTVTYFLTCANIGTGEARDIVLKNPIPAGASYVDRSATSDGATLSFEKSGSTTKQAGEVQLIKWSFPQALKPGQERTVRFMVIVK